MCASTDFNDLHTRLRILLIRVLSLKEKLESNFYIGSIDQNMKKIFHRVNTEGKEGRKP